MPNYKVGDQVWVSRKLFRDSYSKVQVSSKLSARRFVPFCIVGWVGKDAFQLDCPAHIRAHPVFHVLHRQPYRVQPPETAQPSRSTPLPVSGCNRLFFKVDRILAHQKRGRGYQWLALMENSNTHDAEWQLTRDFVDTDGILTKAFHDYIVTNKLLSNLH